MNRIVLKFVGLVLGFVLGVVTPLSAEDSQISRRTLKGLSGVYVVVEELQPNLLKYEKYTKEFNLGKAGIQQNVEAKLRKAGIRVFSYEEWQAAPGRPVLYVNINTHESEKYWFSYNITLELRQLVCLQADPAVTTHTQTWSLNLTGTTNIGNLNQINQDLERLLGRFIAARNN